MAISIEALQPNPKNARVHPRRNMTAVMDSLRTFGQQKPIVHAGGVVIAGSAVLLAAKELGWTHIAAVQSNLENLDRRAFSIADNRSAELAEWDDALLAQQLEELATANVNLPELGFNEDELDRLLGNDEPQSDIPLPPKGKPDSVPGELYILGDHRLLVGDATRPEDLRKLLGDRQADLLLTDPPYNVAYEGKTADALTIQNDSMEDSAFRKFLVDAFAAADTVMRPGAAFYIWHADSEGYNFRGACRDVGWPVRQCLIWAKDHFVLGRQDYQWKHEPCLYGWKPGAAHQWCGDYRQTTIADFPVTGPIALSAEGCSVTIDNQAYWIRGRGLKVQSCETTVLEFDRPSRNADHPTMKPVELFEYQIRNSTRVGQIVLDPFGGSGTTVIAAERSRRCAYTMELDPHYADVIRRRWAEIIYGKKCNWQSYTLNI